MRTRKVKILRWILWSYELNDDGSFTCIDCMLTSDRRVLRRFKRQWGRKSHVRVIDRGRRYTYWREHASD